ncbi:hypothetical protein J4231_03280 [Candidatus Woesearchaeota archaeon]|nr:hypothetical protein [Candidatus Woesearchaeota archaeon]
MGVLKKRGEFGVLEVLIGLLIGGIIVGIIIVVGSDIIKLVPGSKESDDAYFRDLIDFIDLKDKEIQMQYYVSDDHFLAGFGMNDETLKAYWFYSYEIKRPVVQCGKVGEASCICNCELDKDGNINSNGCLDARCKRINEVSEVRGITLLDDDIENAREGSLIIKGRNKILLDIKREDSTITFSMPR